MVGVLAILSLAFCANAETPARDHQIVAEDYFSIGIVADATCSPDGQYVAYTESRWEPPADKRNVDLWVVATESGQGETGLVRPRRLTFDKAADSNPRWSPDSQYIYYTSAPKRSGEEDPPYNGKKQVWRIGVDGGEAFPVTRVDKGVGLYDLAAGGNAIYYTTDKKHVAEEWKSQCEEFDHLTYGWGVINHSQVWKLDLQTWRAEKLVDEDRVVGQMAVSPDGQRIAMLTTPTEEIISNEGRSRVDVYDTETKTVTTLIDKQWREEAPSPYGWLNDLAWSADSHKLAFRIEFDGYPSEIFVAQFGSTEIPITKLPRPDEVFPHTIGMHWRGPTDELCFVAHDHARTRLYGISGIANGKHGPSRLITPGEVTIDSFTFSQNGDRLTFVSSGLTHPQEVFTAPADGETKPEDYRRLTNANPQIDTWMLPAVQTVTWKGWNGDEVEGILELPPDYKPGQRLPLIVEIHGGPTSATQYQFRFWIYGRTLMPARGYALLSPNYRGSTGYGDKFLTELIGHKNDRDVQDILSGVDAMIEQGIADPDRLAVMGWSNGGYVTNCLITTTTRFKAASSGAGVFDSAMQWMAEDTPGHVINFQQGFPWNRAEAMRASSPLYNVDKVTTPTLIHVGENDPRCPPEHSRGLFRSLHEYVKTPTQLLVYPGEGHGLSTYKNRKAKMNWDIAWFDKYVPATTPGTTTGQAGSDPT
jgi:dipeptidyl aminopeptidase/acylaminoacyl peptidase